MALQQSNAKKKVLGTGDIAKKDYVDPNRAAEAQQWVEQVLGKSVGSDFFDALKDGCLLCELLNKIKPGTCKKFKPSKQAFVARSNIQIFLQGCKKIGIPETDLFETRDLYDGQRLSAVVGNIYALSAMSRKLGFGGPFIGVQYAEKNKRQFTQEQLNKSKSSVPSWNKGSIYNKTKNMDGAGIIKTEMNKHSGVQSNWEKGSIEQKTKNMDGAGIIKTDMNKHSGVQSNWEKGSIEQKTKNMDGAGIIKTDMNKHTGVQSNWEKGSNYNATKNMDSAGIIKTENNQHSGVQSNWEKGSIEQKNKNMDGAGIIKTQQY